MSTDNKPLRVALLGCGVVGSQVARLIHDQAADLTARVGAPVELVGVAVRRPELQRGGDVPAELSPPTPSAWSRATTSTSWSR